MCDDTVLLWKLPGVVVERFIRATCPPLKQSKAFIPFQQIDQTSVLPEAFEKAEEFLKNNKIDRNTITALDLSGLSWDINVEEGLDPIRKENDVNYRHLYFSLFKDRRVLFTANNVLLRLVQEIAPNLKTINMRNWIWKPPSIRKYGSANQIEHHRIVTNVILTLSKFKELETLEFSYKDLMICTGPATMEGNSDIIEQLRRYPLRQVAETEKAFFPKLKTICVIGGILSAKMQTQLKAARPGLVIECY